MLPANHAGQADPLTSLHKQWAIYGLFSLLYLIVFFVVLIQSWENIYALRWLGLSGLVTGYLSFILWRNLDQNRLSEHQPVLPNLGWANTITFFRGMLVASLTGFITLPLPSNWTLWLPGCLYSLAAIADILDGYLARRTNRVTRLGTILDLSFDGLGVLVAALLLIQYGKVPMVYILVALARYLFLAGLWVYKRVGKPVYELPASRWRQIFASVQFAFIAVVLFPVFTPPATTIAAIFFAIPFLFGFLWDWLLVSGAVQNSTIHQLLALQKITPTIQILVRLLLAGFACFSFYRVLTSTPAVSIEVLITNFLLIITAFLNLLGIAGRITSGLALGLLGLLQIFAPLDLIQFLQVTGYIAIVFLGSGPYAIWSPEEYWYTKKMNSIQTSPPPHETLTQIP